MAIWGALIGAAATAYSASRSQAAQANAAQASNAQNLDMFNASNRFNQQEAEKTREYNALEAQKAREFDASMTQNSAAFNSAEAAKNRDWQTEMSNTSYQRAVGDMKSAGLNPMLAYSQGGASAGSGSAASASAIGGPSASAGGTASSASVPRAEPVQQFSKGQLIANTASSFLDIDRKLAEIENIRQDTEGKSAVTHRTWEETTKLKNTMEQAIRKADWEALNEEQKNVLGKQQAILNEIEGELKQKKISETEAYTKLLDVQKNMANLQIPGLSNQAEFESSIKTAPQYLKMIQGILSTAQGARNLGK